MDRTAFAVPDCRTTTRSASRRMNELLWMTRWAAAIDQRWRRNITLLFSCYSHYTGFITYGKITHLILHYF